MGLRLFWRGVTGFWVSDAHAAGGFARWGTPSVPQQVHVGKGIQVLHRVGLKGEFLSAKVDDREGAMTEQQSVLAEPGGAALVGCYATAACHVPGLG